jgi:hypothetical protein
MAIILIDKVEQSNRSSNVTTSGFFHIAESLSINYKVTGRQTTSSDPPASPAPTSGERWIMEDVASFNTTFFGATLPTGTANGDIIEYDGSLWSIFVDVSNSLPDGLNKTNEGQLVYVVDENKFYFYDSTAWVSIESGSDTDTTYTINTVPDTGDSTQEIIRLTAGGSGSGTDDIILKVGTGLSIAEAGDTITFTNTVTDTDTQLTNEQVQDIVGAMFTSNTETRCTVTYQDADGTIDVVVDDLDTDTHITTEEVQDIVGAMFTSNTETRCAVTYQDADGTIDVVVDDLDTDTQLTNEQVQDIVGAMFSSNTETRVAVTYQDADGTIDVVVDDMNDTYTAGDGLDLTASEFKTDLKTNGGLVIETAQLALDIGAISITGTALKSILPAAIAYEDEANTFTVSPQTFQPVSRDISPSDVGHVVHTDTAATTFTDNVTATGTATNDFTTNRVEKSTLAATAASITTDTAATLYIEGDVTAGTNMTITNNYSLWVDAGNSRFDGEVIVDVISEKSSAAGVTIDGLLLKDETLIFEGTPDGFETTLAAADPTAVVTVTIPNTAGTLITDGDSGTVTNAMLANSKFTVTDGATTQAIDLGDTLNVAATASTGVAINTTTDDKITISGIDASDSIKGVATFSTANFSVTGADVTIKSGGVDLTNEVAGVLPSANLPEAIAYEDEANVFTVTGNSFAGTVNVDTVKEKTASAGVKVEETLMVDAGKSIKLNGVAITGLFIQHDASSVEKLAVAASGRITTLSGIRAYGNSFVMGPKGEGTVNFVGNEGVVGVLNGIHNATDTVITLDSTDGMEDGETVVFTDKDTPATTESKTISTVDSATQITLSAGLTNSYIDNSFADVLGTGNFNFRNSNDGKKLQFDYPDVGGELHFRTYNRRTGVANTRLKMDKNGKATLDEGLIVNNDSGSAGDFNVKGNSDSDLFFCDVSVDRVGVSIGSGGTRHGFDCRTSFGLPSLKKTSNYTMSDTDSAIHVDVPTSGNVTITLPPYKRGRVINITRLDDPNVTSGTLKIKAGTSDFLNGVSLGEEVVSHQWRGVRVLGAHQNTAAGGGWLVTPDREAFSSLKKTANYTMLDGDETVHVDVPTSGSVTITLPAFKRGRSLRILRLDDPYTTNGTLKIKAASGDFLDGVSVGEEVISHQWRRVDVLGAHDNTAAGGGWIVSPTRENLRTVFKSLINADYAVIDGDEIVTMEVEPIVGPDPPPNDVTVTLPSFERGRVIYVYRTDGNTEPNTSLTIQTASSDYMKGTQDGKTTLSGKGSGIKIVGGHANDATELGWLVTSINAVNVTV